jgi:hypothetical protein
VRQAVCHDLRDDFDSKISGLVDTTCLDESNSELTATLTRQLLYFYHAREETDGNRLSLLCQAYIKHKKMLEMPSDLMVYRLQRLTVTCCQAVATLSDVTMSAFTMQLRMLELLTNGKTFGQNHDVVARITAYAVENGLQMCSSVCLSACFSVYLSTLTMLFHRMVFFSQSCPGD